MMEAIGTFFSVVLDVIRDFEIQDLIDILLVSYLIYKAFKLVRETRAEQLIKGILLLAVSYFLAKTLLLKTMSYILEQIFQIGIIALIVLFQPELRRALEKFGRSKVVDFGSFSSETSEKKAVIWGKVIDRLCMGVEKLSETKTGALIVIEQKTKLGEQIDTGVLINADISEEIIGNIFYTKTPLHDGAVIIRDGRILAAACFLPKPQKEEHIASHLGSRHRAAIGISEVSDAIVVIVSEETGTISVAFDGQLTRDFTSDTLKVYLSEKLIPQRDESVKSKKIFWRSKK